jgi:predicted lipoprotein with Yx(FWY)xxD motif
LIPQRIVLASAAGLVAAFLLGACDSSNDNASATVPGSAAPAVPTTAPSGPMVVAKAVNGIGSVVTDEKGMTLYSYGKDQANPSKWTCAGSCTGTWTPVIVGDSVGTSGVAKSLLGTVHRDGRKQLTLAGWPLYRYVGDTQAGQVNGQGKDDEWYAMTPSGRK